MKLKELKTAEYAFQKISKISKFRSHPYSNSFLNKNQLSKEIHIL